MFLEDFPKSRAACLNSVEKGTKYELMACAWLLENGYMVFRNICMRGHIDLIAVKGNSVIKADVKKAYMAVNGSIKSSLSMKNYKHIRDDVKIIFVCDDGTCVLEDDIHNYNKSFDSLVYNKKCRSKSCGKTFSTTVKNKFFCSKECRDS